MKKFLSHMIALALSCLVFISCGNKKVIRLGDSGAWIEQKILSSMFIKLVESETDYKVEYSDNTGGVSLEIEALRNHDIDIYPSHSGTQLTLVNQVEINKDLRSASAIRSKLEEVVTNYHFGHYLGYANNYVILVSRDVATKYDLHKISDLIPVASKIRASCSFDISARSDELSWTEFCKWYGLNFIDPRFMEYNLMYQAIGNKEVDLIIGESANGYNVAFDLVELEDDLNFWVSYEAGWAYNELPTEVIDILKSLEGKFTSEQMSRAMYDVIVDGKSIDSVADWLISEVRGK